MLSLRKYAGGATSLRAYGKKLGDEGALSARRLISADLLHRRWQDLGSDEKLGPPVDDVRLADGRYARQYSGARLSLAAGADQVEVEEAYETIVRVAAIHCIQRAKDQVGGPSNEPYFIVTPIDTGNTGSVSSIRLGVYGDVNGGTWMSGGVVWKGRNPALLTISIVGMEQDGGQEGQVRRDVEKELRNWASNVAQAYSAATGNPTFWQDKGPITDKVLNAMAFFIVKVFGLGDDGVGYGTYDLNYEDLWKNPPPVVEINNGTVKTRGTPVRIGSAETGIYDLYFHWESRPAVAPREPGAEA